GLLAMAGFDALGFGKVLRWIPRGAPLDGEFQRAYDAARLSGYPYALEEATAAYRVLQLTVNAAVLASVWFSGGWDAALPLLLAFACAGHDLLYHVGLGRLPVVNLMTEQTWNPWTPWGALSRLLGRYPRVWESRLQAAVALVLATVLALL